METLGLYLMVSLLSPLISPDGGRITTAKGGTLQPWLVGLAAVTGFLFIVFVLLIVKRVFFKKENARSRKNKKETQRLMMSAGNVKCHS
uniref:Uncharacterized protein n=1 Tax=Denticeps clupeoides TaxID=299321 RepID=A0AAY4AY12_9TELE